MGVIAKVSGHAYDILYDLYITDERLIAVLIQNPYESVDYRAFSVWKDLFGGNPFSKRKEQHNFNLLADERRSKHKSMTPSQLAASHPGNIVFNYDSVASVEIKTGCMSARLKIKVINPAFMVRSFGLAKKQAGETRDFLKLVLPSKLK